MRCEIPHRCVRRKYRIRRHSPFRLRNCWEGRSVRASSLLRQNSSSVPLSLGRTRPCKTTASPVCWKDAKTLAEALRLGAETGYRAVMRPVEGTILTVARAAGEGARGDSLKDVLKSALAAAREALAKTPELLPVLKQAGVVDAGGAGYVRFLEGIHGYALGLPLPEPPKVERYAQTAFATEEFGYCTEFLMEGAFQHTGVIAVS